MSCSQTNVSWNASTDTGGPGLKGYNVYRNGSFLKQVATTSTADTGLAASTIYSYAVSAVDNAGNQSSQSATSSTSTPACASSGGVCSWSHNFGGSTASDSAYAYAVAADGSGNVLLGGRYQGTVNFGGGGMASSGAWDVFIAKYSSAGGYQWAKSFGTTGTNVARGVAVDGSGNLVVAGYFQGTLDFGGGSVTSSASNSMFVAKYSPTGGYLWAQQVGNALGTAVAVDRSGNVVVTGYYSGTVNFGGGALTSINGGTDTFVAKYSSSGSLVWAKSYGGTSTDIGQAIAVDGNGDVLVAGYFMGTANFGSGSMTSAGASDGFLAKYASADGSGVWSKRLGGANNDYSYGVAVDGGNNVVVTGDFSGTVDFGNGPVAAYGSGDIFLAKYTSAGAYVWGQHYGTASTYPSHANAVAVDGSGNIALTGTINDYVDFGGGPLTSAVRSTDVFVAKFTSAAAYVWAKRAGVGFADYGDDIATDQNGNVIVSGDFNQQVDFGCGPLNNSGGQAAFVAKIQP